MYWLDPQSAAGYSVLGAIASAAPFVIGQVTGVDDAVRLAVAGGDLDRDFAGHRRAVRARHDLQDGARRAHPRGGPRLPGIHGPRGSRPHRSACRPTPSKNICPTPWRSAWSITGRRPLPASCSSRRAGTSGPAGPGMFNPVFFTSNMHCMAQTAHEAFVAAPARQFHRLRLERRRRRRWRILRRRLWRRRRRRFLGTARVS